MQDTPRLYNLTGESFLLDLADLLRQQSYPWGRYHDEAGPLPWSPTEFPKGERPQAITLIPHDCTMLRISAFSTVN